MTTTPGDPQEPASPQSGGRMPPAAWFAIGLVAVVVAIGIPLLLFGGDDDTDATTTTTVGVTTTTVPEETTTAPVETSTVATTTTTTTTAETTTTTAAPDPAPAMAPRVYFLVSTEASNLEGPHLAAVARPSLQPDDATELLEPVIQSLLDGVQSDDPDLADLSTTIPEGVTLLGASISDGVADIDLSAEFAEGAGSFSVIGRLAQLVFTATQFDDVEAVVLRIDGEVVEEFTSEGYLIEGPLTREEFYDSALPLVFLDDPAAGATIDTQLVISGIANAFEANVLYEVTLGGEVLAEDFTTATCGSGCWGDFSVDEELPDDTTGEGLVTVFEISAEDGSRINIQSYPVTILPAS